MVPLSSRKVAGVAGVAVGVMFWLGSGELRADRDVEGELWRANAVLAERVAHQEAELERALEELAGLRAAVEAADASKPTKPGTSAPKRGQPGTATEAEAKEKMAFRAKVLEALAPELAAIDARAAEAKKTFDNHHHEFDKPGHGWVKLDVLIDHDHWGVIDNPYYLETWVAIMDPEKNTILTKETSKPKQKKN